jgi:precorrin-6B methylase 2
MPVCRIARVAVVVSALCALPSLALAQAKPFEPTVGQAGKDVVWVPTPQALVEKMLDLAKVTPQDFLMDLGSGDGRTVITAAKRGLRAQGIEYNPDMVELSKRNATAAGVADKATFVKADLFETDFSKAQVVTMFLLPSINLRLRPTILNMKPGTRVVSNSFTMEAWQADATTTVEGDCTTWCTAYLWIVPAKAEGHLAARLEHADAHAAVPGAERHPRLEPAHQRTPHRRFDHLLCRRRYLHGHRQRQLDEGHHRHGHRLERDEEVGRL